SLFGEAPEAIAWPFVEAPLLERAGVMVSSAGHADGGLYAAGDLAADLPRTWLAALVQGARAGEAAAQQGGVRNPSPHPAPPPTRPPTPPPNPTPNRTPNPTPTAGMPPRASAYTPLMRRALYSLAVAALVACTRSDPPRPITPELRPGADAAAAAPAEPASITP